MSNATFNVIYDEHYEYEFYFLAVDEVAYF